MTRPLEDFTPTDDDWMANGLCRKVSRDFYPARNTDRNVAPARAICAECPVAADCLAYALEHDERFGVWGGKTPAQRRALQRANESKEN
jgi:WhiB family redox-sensing transcriptional regulator